MIWVFLVVILVFGPTFHHLHNRAKRPYGL
jgi:hypothetical protein